MSRFFDGVRTIGYLHSSRIELRLDSRNVLVKVQRSFSHVADNLNRAIVESRGYERDSEKKQSKRRA